MWQLLISEPEKSQLSTLLLFRRSPDISEPINMQRCMLEELNFSCKFFNPEKSASTQFPRDMSQLSFFSCFPDGNSADCFSENSTVVTSLATGSIPSEK